MGRLVHEWKAAVPGRTILLTSHLASLFLLFGRDAWHVSQAMIEPV